jgi:hypothetical protein
MNEKAKQAPEVIEVDFSRPVKLRGNRVGKLVRWCEADGPIVDHSSNPHGPIAARTTVPLGPEAVREAVANDQEVLLVFEAERSDKPIIVGLIQPRDSHVDVRRHEEQSPSTDLEALVDGKRISLQAEDEITLRCGEASITLQRNGRIVVRGAYVETRSKGVNRIKGGTVRIN